MSLNIEKFSGPGSTDPRRKFWDNVVDYLTSKRKTQGKNVSVTEFVGYGTIVNVDRKFGAPSGPCPAVDVTEITATFSGITGVDCDCVSTEFQSYKARDYTALNDSFVLPVSDPGHTFQDTVSPLFTVDIWLVPTGCEGPPDNSVDGFVCFVQTECNDGIWTVQILNGFGYVAFYGVGVSPISNQLVCGPDGPYLFSGGTVTITV